MTGDKSKTGPQDGSRINVTEDHEVQQVSAAERRVGG